MSISKNLKKLFRKNKIPMPDYDKMITPAPDPPAVTSEEPLDEIELLAQTTAALSGDHILIRYFSCHICNTRMYTIGWYGAVDKPECPICKSIKDVFIDGGITRT